MASDDVREFPPVDGMTFAQLLEAVAINSDMATHAYTKRSAVGISDAEQERLKAQADRYYDRRNDCMCELLRRNAALTDET